MKSTYKVLMLEIRGIRSYDIKYVHPDKLDNVNIDTVLKNHLRSPTTSWWWHLCLLEKGIRTRRGRELKSKCFYLLYFYQTSFY